MATPCYWILAAIAVGAACGDTLENNSSTTGAQQPGGDPTFPAIQSEIFAASCSFDSCHGGQKPAASLKLDAVDACDRLVGRASCLFPNETLVSAGKPDESFLLDKLLDKNLSSTPASGCAATNQRMPFGADPLPPERIAQITTWITAGAACPGSAGDAGVDASPDAGGDDAGTTVAVNALAAPSSTVPAGQSMTITLTLDGPAPAGGQEVDISVDDDTVLAAPAKIMIDAGQTQGTFPLMGKRPARPRTLTATSGGASKSAQIGVSGLWIAEVLFTLPTIDDGQEWFKLYNSGSNAIDLSSYSLGAGHHSYTFTTVPLAGVIQPGGCYVIGGPLSGPGNGSPVYSRVFNFFPDLPDQTDSGQGVGFALFDVQSGQIMPATVPIDSFLVGGGNVDLLVGPDGEPLVPAMADVTPGSSALRTAQATWIEQPYPAPGVCTAFIQ